MVRVPSPRDGVYAPRWMLPSERIDNRNVLRAYEPCDTRSPGGDTDESTDLWLFENLFARLSGDTDDLLSQHALQVLNILPQRLARSPSQATFRGDAPLVVREDGAILEMVRTMLDQAWRETADSLLLSSPLSASTAENVFPVLRFALDEGVVRTVKSRSYDFSARLLIPTAQRAVMAAFLQAVARGETTFRDDGQMTGAAKADLFATRFGSDAERALDALESPLETEQGSISDTVFQSGQMDFLATGFTQSDRTERVSPRADAERLLLGEHGLQLFYVPVHVGGTPWIALLSMNTDEGAINSHFWRHIFQFYGAIVPVLAANIRRAARRAYADAVTRTVADCLATAEQRNIRAINENLQRLCAFFPFQLVQVEKQADCDEDDEPRARKLEGAPLAVNLHANPYSTFATPLTFDRFTHEEALNACDVAFEEHERRTLQMSRDNATTWAHEISNAVLPALSALQHGLGKGANREVEDDIKSAMHWLLFMGATARVRNAIGKHIAASGANDTPTPEGQSIWALPAEAQRRAIEASLHFLLRSQARILGEDTPLLANSHALFVEGLQDDAEMEELAAIVAKYDQSNAEPLDRDIAIFHSDIVSWPMALLRELVQNIRLDNPTGRTSQRRIEFSFEWVEPEDASVRTILRTCQRQIEDRRWEDFGELPDGIQRANLVYGREGAKFGEISAVSLCQTPIGDGGRYEIEYILDVKFLGEG
jgi:hypothetical protein